MATMRAVGESFPYSKGKEAQPSIRLITRSFKIYIIKETKSS